MLSFRDESLRYCPSLAELTVACSCGAESSGAAFQLLLLVVMGLLRGQ